MGQICEWARAQNWPTQPGEPSTLTGQTLDEHPLPAPGETLQALMPDLQINEGRAQTTAHVSLTEQDTWNDEDGVLLAEAQSVEYSGAHTSAHLTNAAPYSLQR